MTAHRRATKASPRSIGENKPDGESTSAIGAPNAVYFNKSAIYAFVVYATGLTPSGLLNYGIVCILPAAVGASAPIT